MVGKPKKRRKHPEEDIQKAVISFLRGLKKVGVPLRYLHPANELLRTSNMKMLYWALGIESGVPDVLIFLRGGITIFIELKVEPNGLSETQMEWENDLCSMGFEHHIYTAKNSSIMEKAKATHFVAGILNKHGLKV